MIKWYKFQKQSFFGILLELLNQLCQVPYDKLTLLGLCYQDHVFHRSDDLKGFTLNTDDGLMHSKVTITNYNLWLIAEYHQSLVSLIFVFQGMDKTWFYLIKVDFVWFNYFHLHFLRISWVQIPKRRLELFRYCKSIYGQIIHTRAYGLVWNRQVVTLLDFQETPRLICLNIKQLDLRSPPSDHESVERAYDIIVLNLVSVEAM